MVEESSQSEQPPAQPAQPEQPAASPGIKKPKVPLAVQEAKLSPRPSMWPIALAAALVFTAIGVIIHPIVFACGIVLTVLVIIGWILEKH